MFLAWLTPSRVKTIKVSQQLKRKTNLTDQGQQRALRKQGIFYEILALRFFPIKNVGAPDFMWPGNGNAKKTKTVTGNSTL